MSNSELRAFVDLRDRQIQKARIAFSNRLSAIDRNTDDASNSSQKEVVTAWFNLFHAVEQGISGEAMKYLKKNKDILQTILDIPELGDIIRIMVTGGLDGEIGRQVEEEPIYEEMSQLRGIGPMLAAKIIAMVDIEVADSVSALWRYSGYGVGKYWEDEEGKVVAPQIGMKWLKTSEVTDEVVIREAEEKVLVRIIINPKPEWKLVEMRDRPLEGWLLPYNKRLKTTLYLVASSFLKCGSPYRLFFDNARLHYAVTHPEWKPAHVRDASMRKMTKMFLSHCWLRWRLLEGLPTRQPYAFEKLEGHTHYYAPEDFGWGKAEIAE